MNKAIELARECGFFVSTELKGSTDKWEAFYQRAHRAGQEAMRERAAEIVSGAAPGFCGGRAEIVMNSCANTIRELEIE